MSRSFLAKYLVHYPFHLANGQRLWARKEKFEKTQWLPADSLRERQWDLTRKMLKYAAENVPYYRNRFREAGIRPEDIRTMEDYLHVPVLTKEDIKTHFDSLLCDTRKIKGYARKTSGSSGSPLRVVKDGEALSVMDAVMFRNYNWFGVGIGDRQARFWGSPLDGAGKAKTRAKDFLLNRIRLSPFDQTDASYLGYLRRIREFRPRYIYGYAQTVYNFSRFLAGRGDSLSDLKLLAVILTGEMVYADQVETIERAFGCKVSNEYGCTEAGIIAMTCPEKEMHLMTEYLLIEFERDGRHVSDGEEGDILLTELQGDLMPLIRYRIEDIGSPGNGACRCGRNLPILRSLKGRSDDFILLPGGKRIDPIFFEYILKALPKKYGTVKQFRIVQEEDFRLEIEMCHEGGKFDLAAAEIRAKMAEVLGSTVETNLRKTDVIPVERSGKLRCFVSRVKDAR